MHYRFTIAETGAVFVCGNYKALEEALGSHAMTLDDFFDALDDGQIVGEVTSKKNGELVSLNQIT